MKLESIFDPPCSLFPTALNPTPSGAYTITEILHRIEHGMYRLEIMRARNVLAHDKTAYAELKKTLPAVTFQGRFSYRRKTDLTESSGFLMGDLDHLDDPEETKKRLSDDPYVAACFVSPSGHGLKVLVRIPRVTSDQEYKRIFEQVRTHFDTTYAVEFDPARKDISGLCFVSDDPDLYQNENAECFPVNEPLLDEPPPSKPSGGNGRLAPIKEQALQKMFDWKLKDLAKHMQGATEGTQYTTRRDMGRLAGGIVAGFGSSFWTESDAVVWLMQYYTGSTPDKAQKDILKHIEYGKRAPITSGQVLENWEAYKRDHPSIPRRETPPHPGTKKTPERFETDQMAGKRAGLPGKIADFLTVSYSFSYNELKLCPYANGLQLSDEIESEMYVSMVSEGLKGGKSLMRDVVSTECCKHRFHPLKDYFHGLTWDHTPRFEVLGDYFTDEHDIFSLYLRKWMIGAVSKVFTGSQNPMLVLVGAQGIGKGFLSKKLSPFPEMYIEKHIQPDNNDHSILLTEIFVWEASELGATTRRQDIEALKSFLSLERVSFRRPYGHFNIEKQATASFIGTVNKDEVGFLNDVTGNRRYRPVHLLEIDRSYPDHTDFDQLWAEAFTAYKAGETHDLTEEKEEQLRIGILPLYKTVDIMQDLLEEHFQHSEGGFCGTAELLRGLECVGYRGTNSRKDAMDLARSMTALGYKKSSNGKTRGYAGIVPTPYMIGLLTTS